jgi:hypothetical protein
MVQGDDLDIAEVFLRNVYLFLENFIKGYDYCFLMKRKKSPILGQFEIMVDAIQPSYFATGSSALIIEKVCEPLTGEVIIFICFLFQHEVETELLQAKESLSEKLVFDCTSGLSGETTLNKQDAFNL